MGVTINQGDESSERLADAGSSGAVIHVFGKEIPLDMITTFGRLDLPRKHIEMFFGLTGDQVSILMAREDVRGAWNRGRVEVVMHLRNKLIKGAIAGDKAHLTEALRLFGDLDNDSTMEGRASPAQGGPSYNWDTTIMDRIRSARQQFSEEVSGPSPKAKKE